MSQNKHATQKIYLNIVTSAQAVCVLGSLSIMGGAQNQITCVMKAWSEHLVGSCRLIQCDVSIGHLHAMIARDDV